MAIDAQTDPAATAPSPQRPPRPPARQVRWVEPVVAALCAVTVTWLGTWGFATLQASRQAGHRARAAVAVADTLAAAAGLEAKQPGTLQPEVDRLAAAHKPLVARVFVTAQGGVDEFGIARGGALKIGGAGLDTAATKALTDHDKGLVAAAERAVKLGQQLPWSRLSTRLPDGRAVVAVPYRSGSGATPGGIAGVVLRPAPAPEGSPAWVWAAPAVAALAVFLGLLAGLPAWAAGVGGQLLGVALVVAGAPALVAASEGGVAVLAADHIVPHAGPPVNAALAAAETWLGVALLVLGALFGAILGFLAALARAMRGDPAPYVYVGPAVLATGVLIFVPFFVGVGLSFTTADGTFSGVDNYLEVIRSFADDNSATHFTRTLAHTVLWTLLNVTAHVTIGLALALVLNRPALAGRKLYRLLLIVPWAVPNYITALTWKWMFNTQYGPINVMLGGLGVEPVDWLGESVLTNFLANLITNIWLGFPFMMVISLGALQSIPGELYEAAAIDGASPWQKFRHITLPLLRPALFPAIILGTIWTFNAFNVIYLVSGGGPDHQTEILITEAYYLFTVLRRIGLAAAYSVLIFVLLLAYTLITNRLTSATEAVDR